MENEYLKQLDSYLQNVEYTSIEEQINILKRNKINILEREKRYTIEYFKILQNKITGGKTSELNKNNDELIKINYEMSRCTKYLNLLVDEISKLEQCK